MRRTDKSDGILAGVCGGYAEELEIDPVWIRLSWVLITVLLTLINMGFLSASICIIMDVNAG